MPSLSKRTQATLINKAIQVFVLMSQGKTQKDACEEIGITPYQFRRWLSDGDEAINTIRDMTVELEKSNLADIIVTRSRIIRRISDVIATQPLPAKDLVAVDAHLKLLQEELENKYGTQSQDVEAQAFLLNGPTIEQHESVFSARVTHSQTIVKINKPEPEPIDEIIEGSFEEEED